MVCIFYLSSQRTSFSFVDFCYGLFYFAFISALIFKISFLLLTLGFFVSSFSSCFRCRVRLFVDFFLVSWGKPVLLWTFPLVLLLQCPIGFGVLGGSEVKPSAWNAGDPGSIPGSGRSPGEGNGGNPLQYSCLENPMGYSPWDTTEPLHFIGLGLLCFHFHSFLCIFWFLLRFFGYSAACCSVSICWKF